MIATQTDSGYDLGMTRGGNFGRGVILECQHI